ncbi:MAG TPA: CheR family methyltransferase, partial [Chloroflexia bacterium]|nr:CheR family methyltransferase [Chloroflexia bacterium]
MLSDLINGTETPTLYEQPADAVEEILAMVNRQASIDFAQYRPSTILRRIARRMVVHRVPTLDAYKDYVREHTEEATELARAFLIKVTEFFRDPEAFDFLKTTVLPELIDQARGRGNVLRFWSAGCATGEEPYSLALLVTDLLGPELPQWNVKIFATDLDEGAINFARRGFYPENLLVNLPEIYRTLYFEPAQGGYHVSKALRQMVIFGQQDLSRGVPFPRVDLVVCRNLLIYFQPQLQQQVLDTFCYSLSHNRGFLFLGHAETVRPSQATFEQVNKRWKVYRCISPRPLQRNQPALTASGDGLERRTTQRGTPAPSGQIVGTEPLAGGKNHEVLTLRRFNELVLRQLPTGVVVLDRVYRIVSINASARRLLGIRDTGVDRDFLHTVRGLPYSQVRAAIDTAFRERTAVLLPEVELEQVGGGTGRYVALTMVPVEAEHDGPDLQVVSVEDVTDTVELRRNMASTQTELRELLGEMQNSNRRLSDMNKDLQDANEELQAANEEFMLPQEELQATNEEFETTNEELQATNEELETNNEELQATNEEL